MVIKRILPAYGRDEDFVRMFADEARILGLIHHPNVVQAYEFGEDDGTLVPGARVRRAARRCRASCARCGPPTGGCRPRSRPTSRARSAARSTACTGSRTTSGVRLDVVHRDVTPSNIIVTPWGGVKLLDFGVAKFASAARSTREGTVKGKPAYLAPEQLQGKPIDGRVDLFALGIVMHEMLSLQHLFAGDSDLQTAKKIMEMKIPRLDAHRADVPEELEQIVMRALERDRQQRFATAAEMARALDDFVVGSKLHLDEVAAFVREIEAISPLARPRPLERRGAASGARGAAPPGAARHRRRADGQGSRPPAPDAGAFRPSGPHLAAAVGLALAVLGLATALGLRITTAAGDRPPAAPAITWRRRARAAASSARSPSRCRRRGSASRASCSAARAADRRCARACRDRGW